MVKWFDVVDVEVTAEWEPPDEELHPGYWDITVVEVTTDEDITAKIDSGTIKRFERKAQELADDSWNDAAIDFNLDVGDC